MVAIASASGIQACVNENMQMNQCNNYPQPTRISDDNTIGINSAVHSTLISSSRVNN